MTGPLRYLLDRSQRVPRDKVVRTAWVPLTQTRAACRDMMGTGDVDSARAMLLQNRDANGSPYGTWPPPFGHWEGEVFVIQDGRHERLAREMMGDERILVAWLASA